MYKRMTERAQELGIQILYETPAKHIELTDGEVTAVLAENTSGEEVRVECIAAVIATGGSVPLREKAMEHLKSQGKVVYLKVALPEIKKRLSNIKTRGIAFGPGQTLESLYQERCPIYEKWADITVSPNPHINDIEDMVEKIVSML